MKCKTTFMTPRQKLGLLSHTIILSTRQPRTVSTVQFPAEKGKEVFVSTEVRRFNFLMAMSGAAPARTEQFPRVRVWTAR